MVISLKKNGRFLTKIKKVCNNVCNLGLPLKVSIVTWLLFPYAFLKFLLLCLKYRPEIIHSFLFQANIIARFTKIFLWNTKVICSERVAEKEKLWQNVVNRLTNFLVDKIVVNSDDLKNFVITRQKVSLEKVVVIPNMIDTHEIKIQFSAEQLRKMLGLSSDKFIICSAGRLHKQKGYDLLLEIVKNIVSECNVSSIPKNFVVIVLGDGEEYKNLVSYAEKLGVSNYVRFLGYCENIYDYINMCNLFVLTSYWEGFPNVVLEALFLNRPVISTDVEGVKEVLDAKYIVSLKQRRQDLIKVFSQKILDLYKEYLKSESMSFSNNVNLNMFFPEVVVKKYLDLYC